MSEPLTLTLTYACGHQQQVSNDTGAASRIEFLRQYNCVECRQATGKMKPTEGDPAQFYCGPAYRPETPNLRPILAPEYLRRPRPSIAQEIDLWAQQAQDPKKLN